MVKILHVADLHLDSPFVGMNKQMQNLQQELIQAPYQAFERCVSIAINQKVDVFVIVGDVYDASKQTIYAQHFFSKQLERLDKVNIPVVLIHGNHDYLNEQTIRTRYTDNVHHIRSQQIEHVDLTLDDQSTIRFYGFSYQQRWVTERKIHEFPKNTYETDYTIGLLHGAIEGENSSKGNYAPFSVQELLSKNYDYWALGHIHQAHQLNKSPLIQYSGTIQGRNRLENGDKGAYIVEIEKGSATKSQFVSLAKIVYETVAIDSQSSWQAVDLVEKINDVSNNYLQETLPNQQSYLLSIELTNAQRLPQELQEQIETGELMATISQHITDNFFVIILNISLEKSIAMEAFQYDPTLNLSYQNARKSLFEGDLYQEVLNDVFNHSIVKSYLDDFMTDQELKEQIVQQAHETMVQSIGFELEEVAHEN